MKLLEILLQVLKRLIHSYLLYKIKSYFLGYLSQPSIFGNFKPSVTLIATEPSSSIKDERLFTRGLESSAEVPHVFERDWEQVEWQMILHSKEKITRNKDIHIMHKWGHAMPNWQIFYKVPWWPSQILMKLCTSVWIHEIRKSWKFQLKNLIHCWHIATQS